MLTLSSVGLASVHSDVEKVGSGRLVSLSFPNSSDENRAATGLVVVRAVGARRAAEQRVRTDSLASR